MGSDPVTDEPDGIVSNGMWFLVFFTLGLGIIVNHEEDIPGWTFIAGGVSLLVSTWFLFRLLVRRT